MINKSDKLIISLDFELMWGVRDKRTISGYGKSIIGAREAIPQLLNLFGKYDIHATWAVVGFLFARSRKELEEFIPSLLPAYKNDRFSPYRYLKEQVGAGEHSDPYHFAGSLIDNIASVKGQEIATHTFSHYYCLEAGQTPEQFRQDLIAALAIAHKYDHKMTSIVFPRNQYSDDYLAICQQQGIDYFRGNPKSFIYQEQAQQERSQMVRVLRAIDTVMPIDGYHGGLPEVCCNMVDVPASRFLRPISKSTSSLRNSLSLQRITREMEHAAKNGLLYHLWWHPHNFGADPEVNLHYLEKILIQFKHLNEQFGMESRCMREMTTI